MRRVLEPGTSDRVGTAGKPDRFYRPDLEQSADRCDGHRRIAGLLSGRRGRNDEDDVWQIRDRIPDFSKVRLMIVQKKHLSVHGYTDAGRCLQPGFKLIK